MTRNGKAPKAPRRPIFDWILFWMSSGKRIDGIWVGAETEERALPRVEAALDLIKTYDRKRYDRMVRDLDRIWVRLLTNVAQYSPSWRACFLDERFVLSDAADTALIAAAIVHEATHARLWSYGFGYDEEVLRQRVEAICIRREAAFANKLPDGEQVRAVAAEELALPPSYLTDDAARDRKLQGSIEALEHLGDNWVARGLLAFIKWRTGAQTKTGGPQSPPEVV